MSRANLTRFVVVGFISAIAIAATHQRTTQAQSNDDILPGCSIPRSYGRLVNVIPGHPGFAGQAVFQAEDGIVRFVPFVFHSFEATSLRPTRPTARAIFPQLPLYECTAGAVWQRH
jgi:hypothetical protein